MSVKIGETEMEKKILFQIREDWLALHREDAIDPAMPIIDPHHHLWDRGGARYLLQDIKNDIDAAGHNIRATVFLQCDSMYRADGDPKLAPVGETEFVNGIAAMAASDGYGPARICAGIVGFADLLLGADVVAARIDVALVFIEQVTRAGAIPQMMMRIDDRHRRLDRLLAPLREPILADRDRYRRPRRFPELDVHCGSLPGWED